jgi:3-methyladenine DNA glycosylase AlkD
MLLGRFPDHLKSVSKQVIIRWLSQLSGWEEVDSFCDELAVWLIADITHRLPTLKQWAGDEQIGKRRASLVVLCSAVRLSDEKKLVELSCRLIDQLKHEKSVRIPKAISWLLRSLLKYHCADVIAYLKKEKASLPAIAVRETTKKLETGTK